MVTISKLRNCHYFLVISTTILVLLNAPCAAKVSISEDKNVRRAFIRQAQEATALTAIIVCVFLVWGLVSARSAHRPAPATQAADSRQAVILYATPFGFEPAEITIPAGATAIMIRNRTGLDKVNFAITTQRGQSPGFSTALELGNNATARLSLPAGETIVSEAEHLEWICRIQVQP